MDGESQAAIVIPYLAIHRLQSYGQELDSLAPPVACCG